MDALERYNKPCTILYITNIHYDTSDKELESTFGNIVPIKEVYIIYKSDGTSTGTGEVVLHSQNDATILRDRINNTMFKGRILRAKLNIRREDILTYFTHIVDNLPLDVTSRELKEHFRPPFTVKKASVLYNEDGSSTGIARVEFLGNFSEIDDIYECDQCKIKGQKMTFRGLYTAKCFNAENLMKRYNCLQLYIVNLHYDVKAEDLEAYFGRWIEIAEAIIYYNEDGTSTGTGTITFYKFESIPNIFTFVRKAFEDRLESVMCLYDIHDCSENVKSNFDTIEEEVKEYADLDEKFQSTSTQTEVVGKQRKKYNDSEDVEVPSRMDDIILLRQFNKGGSKERLLKLKHYNSFANQHFR